MAHQPASSLTTADLEQLAARGISRAEALAQLALLRTPSARVRLDRPCTVDDGIVRLDPARLDSLLDRGDAVAAAGRVLKFVPASGAATRMFADLLASASGPVRPSATPAGHELFSRLDEFPFADELRRRAGLRGAPTSEADERRVLDVLLVEMGLARLSKALVPFHRTDRVRSAFEEHVAEGTRYLRDAEGVCRMHFAVTPADRGLFETVLADVRPRVEALRGGASLRVTFSEQHPSTDALALAEDGAPARQADGRLLLRPAGHGALLRNLQDTSADLVVIKNIDNVLPDETAAEAGRWKRLLIGHLAGLQAEVFAHLDAIRAAAASDDVVARAAAFAANKFGRALPDHLERAARRQWLHDALDRPLRVCGVVRNAGEPGGAPFWVRGRDGRATVQLVEGAQVDPVDHGQQAMFRRATHFNPVDLVCALRGPDGASYELAAYVDPGTALVSTRSVDGRDVTVLERPGLWNGSMAGWNTVCVEVPPETFAPVKTVFDLLRPEHQVRSSAAR
jgi:hypothetical protein